MPILPFNNVFPIYRTPLDCGYFDDLEFEILRQECGKHILAIMVTNVDFMEIMNNMMGMIIVTVIMINITTMMIVLTKMRENYDD